MFFCTTLLQETGLGSGRRVLQAVFYTAPTEAENQIFKTYPVTRNFTGLRHNINHGMIMRHSPFHWVPRDRPCPVFSNSFPGLFPILSAGGALG